MSFFPKELKDAISRLSSAEKDKLIFRLNKKDLDLANQLLFKYVSNDSAEELRNELQKRLAYKIQRITTHYYSPGYLNMDVRDMSGAITEHSRITKDKYGEAYLNLWMMNEVLSLNNKNILSAGYNKAEKFCVAIIARVFKIMLLINKMHEDYFIEFRDDLVKLGKMIKENSYLKQTSIKHKLDINWLLDANIPEDIHTIHKSLREDGYLKY